MCKTSVRFVSCFLLLSMVGVALGDIVGHWKFDEGSGGIANDSSGRGHHGQILGTPVWTSGPTGFGGALGFNPATCKGVDCGVFDPTNGTGEFSVAFWAFWEGTGTFQHFLTKSNGWGAATMMFQVELWGAHTNASYTDRVGISYEPAGSVAFSIMPKNEWVHLAFAFDGANLRLYLNGVDEQGPKPFSIGPNIDAPVLIGVDYNAGRVFEGLLDDFRIYDEALPDAQIKGIMKGMFGLAADANPADGATDVPYDTGLSWTPGEFAVTHDVYLGTVFSDVNDASRTDPRGVLVSQDQASAAYEPVGLEYGRTYHWRIDEVNAPPDSTIFKGQVWTFTTEPFGYPIADVTTTASSARAGMGPENTVNGSGLSEDDRHSTKETDMWLSTGQLPNWIQFEFDEAYKLHELWVWNSNQVVEGFIGFGAKDVTVEYSTDGTVWMAVEAVSEFARASGSPTYAANTVVEFGGASAKFVKLTINSTWGGVAPQTGLSEVRFFYIPLQARGPQPADGATGVSIDTELGWRPGREAAAHEVYFGADENAMALVDTLAEHSSTPGSLDFGTTYFWKVNEIGGDGPYEGEVWSFTTQEYAAVEDFESYNDDDNRIYDTWVDGWVNNTGSQVGYDVSPFAERTIVHGGRQSMPFTYNNEESPFYSEAEREFATAQNWTVSGADTVSLWVQDAPANRYVAVEDSAGKIATVTGAAATAPAEWTLWTIPQSDFAGVNMARVKKMFLGVGNRTSPVKGGAGIFYVDDIGFGHPAQ